MKNLEQFGVSALSNQEIKTTDGGKHPILGVIAVAIGAANLAIYLIDHHEEVAAGFEAGQQAAGGN